MTEPEQPSWTLAEWAARGDDPIPGADLAANHAAFASMSAELPPPTDWQLMRPVQQAPRSLSEYRAADPDDAHWAAMDADYARARRYARIRHAMLAATLIIVGIAIGVVATGTGRAARSPAPHWHRATSSWYGAGFYGHHLACGGTLTTRTRGVAHRTLPCGSPVTLRYHGRIVHTRVVDRGPFVTGRTFDLTARTAMDLERTARPYTITHLWRI